MRARLESLEEDQASGYTTAKGQFFKETQSYILEAYQRENQGKVAVKLFVDGGDDITEVVRCQPQIRNGCLCVSSEQPSLPRTDAQVEAYAQYVLQLCDESLRFTSS